MEIPQLYQLPREYDVVSCNDCGFCYADTNACQEDYDVYYANYNTYSGTPVKDEAWSSLICTAKKYINLHMTKEVRMLDMGFGKGVFLKWLKKEGYTNVCGIDPSEDSVSQMLSEGIEVKVGSIFDNVQPNECNAYGCVFLFDVLEHLLFPLEAISNLKKYLITNGYLLLSVPNYAALENNSYPLPNVFNQEHINYFSIISLDNLMSICGFERVEINSDIRGEEEEIIALYQLKDNNEEGLIVRDDYCELSVNGFIQKFETVKKVVNTKINELKALGIESVYIWGTGAYTMWLLANSDICDFSIQFIDNNQVKIGSLFYNSLIVSPFQITDSERPILICSMLYSDEIEYQIRQMGLTNRVVKL